MDTVKKFGAGSNKVTGVGKDAAKLDRETEELSHDRYGATLAVPLSSMSRFNFMTDDPTSGSCKAAV